MVTAPSVCLFLLWKKQIHRKIKREGEKLLHLSQFVYLLIFSDASLQLDPSDLLARRNLWNPTITAVQGKNYRQTEGDKCWPHLWRAPCCPHFVSAGLSTLWCELPELSRGIGSISLWRSPRSTTHTVALSPNFFPKQNSSPLYILSCNSITRRSPQFFPYALLSTNPKYSTQLL